MKKLSTSTFDDSKLANLNYFLSSTQSVGISILEVSGRPESLLYAVWNEYNILIVLLFIKCIYSRSCSVINVPDITFQHGRKDCVTSPKTTEEYKFPDAAWNRSTMLNYFSEHFGYTTDEVSNNIFIQGLTFDGFHETSYIYILSYSVLFKWVS